MSSGLLFLSKKISVNRRFRSQNFRKYGEMKSRARQRQGEEKVGPEKIRKERVRRKKMQMREKKVGQSRNIVFVIPVGFPLLTCTPAFFRQKMAVHLALLK